MYSQEVTRRHRAAIVVAIDQSCSMSGRMTLNGWDLSKGCNQEYGYAMAKDLIILEE